MSTLAEGRLHALQEATVKNRERYEQRSKDALDAAEAEIRAQVAARQAEQVLERAATARRNTAEQAETALKMLRAAWNEEALVFIQAASEAARS